MSEDELATLAARGDPAAFARLVDLVYDRVFRLAFTLSGRREEAEDIVQDICVSLPRKLETWQGRSSFGTWLYRVTINASRDRFRRQDAHERASAGWCEWETNRRAEIRQTEELSRWLRQAMEGLTPPELRETLALMLEGLSQEEIAQVLGIPIGTVSWRISESKRKLQEMRFDL